MLRVLSIDGGGIRGIIPATVLTQVEIMSGRRIFELFDLIAGTSTGGILALALTCPQGDRMPLSANDARSLYLERGSRIFPLGGRPVFGPPKGGLRSLLLGDRPSIPPNASVKDKFRNFMGYQNIAKVSAPFGGGSGQGNARYPAEPLEQELRGQLGDTMMSQALRPVAVVSCDFARRIPLVFRGGGLPQGTLGDTKMWHVARATSAGPTFFPAFKYKDLTGAINLCVDGGIVANDPAMVAFTDAQAMLKKFGRDDQEVLLLSLGTGTKEPGLPPELDDVPQLLGQASWASLGAGIVGTVGSAPGELMRTQLHDLLGSQYIRLQIPVMFGAVHAMDNVQPQNTYALERTGEYLVETSRPMLEQLLQLLTP